MFSLYAVLSDSLAVTHFALNFSLKSYDDGFLRIVDNQENFYFQGMYSAGDGFAQTLILPLSADTLYVALDDSLKVYKINNSMSDLTADFNPAPAPWLQRLLWLKHDLEKLFPILAFVIIFIIKRQHDRKKEIITGEEDDDHSEI